MDRTLFDMWTNGVGIGTIKLMVRKSVELRMGRRKSHGQFCILFDRFALGTVKSTKLYPLIRPMPPPGEPD